MVNPSFTRGTSTAEIVLASVMHCRFFLTFPYSKNKISMKPQSTSHLVITMHTY